MYTPTTLAYLAAAVLFILSLRGLSSQERARRGNLYGIIGMGIAVAVTLTSGGVSSYPLTIGAVVIATGIGALMAARVAMTAMPEMVALLHSFVGLSAVLVGFASYMGGHGGTEGLVLLVEISVDVFIGAITFTGSVLAFAKLRGSVSGKPLLLPGRHLFNAAMAIGSVVLAVMVARITPPDGLTFLIILAGIAAVLGVHLVAAIGGADMPVVVSMLNSYSGWTAAAAGFMLNNDLLVVTGALVGSSGAILSYIMCRAMNRSIWHVIFGGFGGGAGKSKKQAAGSGEERPVEEIDVATLVPRLLAAKNVIVVPGYGMAVARAQHAVQQMTEFLRDKGVNVRFAIHPVAGRLPGHMNVLLAEANVPYDIVMEMDEINEDFPKTDVALVIGANDIVNPSAQTDPDSPIWGMPVLEVWKADLAVVMKRSRATGYAGVDNPLFYHEHTRMLFGDAKDSMDQIVTRLRELDE